MADKVNVPRVRDLESTQRALDSISKYLNNQTTVILRGRGSPEGEVAALMGSLYVNEDGGAQTTLYLKESGEGATGWIPANTVYTATVPAGTIYTFAGTSVPSNFLLCDGSAVSRATYSELFAAIGIAWGSGDGSTTFNVPDLRGMFLRGAGTHGTQVMATGAAFDGGAVGDYVEDKAQGHKHSASSTSTDSGHYHSNGAYSTGYLVPQGSYYGGYTQVINTGTSYANITTTTTVGSPTTDSTNGTPRTGAETKPASYSVKYIILTVSSVSPISTSTGSVGASATYQVKCRSTDTTPDYMANKLAATSPIVKTILNSGANEVVGFSVTDGSTSAKGVLQSTDDYTGSSSVLVGTQKCIKDGLATKQATSANLTSVSGLTYSAVSFVKMTGANTFALDTSTYVSLVSGTANRLSSTGGATPVLDIDTTLLPSPTGGDVNKILTCTGANAATWQDAPASGVTSVSGTANRISVSGTTTVTVDLDTTLIPSPVSGDVGKFLKCTAADTGVWTSVSVGVTGTIKRLGAKDIDGSTNTVNTDYSLYQVGASTYTRSVKVYIANRSGSTTARVRLAHVDAAIASVANEDYVLYDDYLLPYETKIIDIEGMVASDSLLVRSDTANVNFVACGEELTEDVYTKRVAAKDIDGSTNVVNTDYAVWTSDRATRVNAIICNRNAANVAEVQIALVDDDDISSIANEDRQCYTLDARQSLFLELNMDMADDNIISLRSDTANVNMIVYSTV